MRVESAPTPAMLAVHSPPRHALQTFQPQVSSRACAIDVPPLDTSETSTRNKSRLCSAEELTCGASMSNFRQSPASSCLPPYTAVVYMITTALCSVHNHRPQVVRRHPSLIPINNVPCCCAARRGHGSMQAYGRAARRRPFSDQLWGRAPNLARSDLQGNQDPGKPDMHGNGRPSLASLWPA